ncbi:MAG: DUF11 domain-containing protein [Anaerolineae bacterium]|nr:DUF11 domain-containing protein [Anaerolineae bacterium]
MTGHNERVEQVLHALANEPLQVDAKFKQHLIITLQHEQSHFTHGFFSWLGLSRRRIQWVWGGVGAIVVLLLFVWNWALFVPHRVMLTVHQGNAEVIAAHTSSQLPSTPASVAYKQKRPLIEGDYIKLPEDSAAVLSINGSRVELSPGTQLTLTEFKLGSIWTSPAVRMRLTVGEVRAEVAHLRKPEDRFEVEMPAALVSVRGTVFRARVISPTHTYVATDEGVVNVTLNDPDYPQTIPVPAGYEVDAIIGVTMTVRQQLADARPSDGNESVQEGVLADIALQNDAGSQVALASLPAESLSAIGIVSDGVITTGMMATSVPMTTVGVISPTTTPVVTATGSVTETGGVTATSDTGGKLATPGIGSGADARADLEMVIVDTPDPAAADGKLTYVLAVTNHGPADVRGVVITDALPSAVQLVTATLAGGNMPQLDWVSQSLIWYLDELRAGNSRLLYVDVHVKSWVTQTFTNTATVASMVRDDYLYNNEMSVSTMLTTVADLAITDVAITDYTVAPGDVVTYMLTYKNFGPAVAEDVELDVTLPSALRFGGVVDAAMVLESSFVSPAGDPGTLMLGNSTLTWGTPKLAAGVIGRVVFTATVDAPVLGPVTTTVSLITSGSDNNPYNNDASETATIIPTADVAVALDIPRYVIAGEVLTCTLVYRNQGEWAAQDSVITAVLPSGIVWGGVVKTDPLLPLPLHLGQFLTWTKPWLAPGEQGKVVFTVTVPLTGDGILSHQAMIHSSVLDREFDNNQTRATTQVLVPALALQAQVSPNPGVPSLPLIYTFTFTNTGQVTFTPQSLQFVASLPQEFHVITSTLSGYVAPYTLTWNNFASVTPGTSLSFTALVSTTQIITPGVYSTVLTMTARVGGQVVSVTDVVSALLTSPSVGLVSQEVPEASVSSGNFSVTMQVLNLGVSAVDVISVVNQYDPTYLRLVRAMPVPVTHTGYLSWTDLTLPPYGVGHGLDVGESISITMVFSIIRPLTAPVTAWNVMTVTGGRDIYGNAVSPISNRIGLHLGRTWMYLPLVVRC